MPNSQYFQPMVHRPLPDIRKYALLSNRQAEFLAVIKPEGIDIYVNNGKLYDFYHNEIQNQYLQFHFEKLLQTSINMQATIIGTLVGKDSLKLKRYRHTIYNKTKSQVTEVKFFVYDIIFPVFNIDHVYKMRYDIADKVIGILPNCQTCNIQTIKDEYELQKVVGSIFSIDAASSILVYDKEGKFVPGISQLTWNDDEGVSYIVEAKQRYRAHIKRIVSTTVRMDNGDKIEVAMLIIARFKKENIEIPIDLSNFALRTFIWQNRIALKERPFWFTGYTVLDNRDGHAEYITIINEFLSFITQSE
jgi:hypothetical protein